MRRDVASRLTTWAWEELGHDPRIAPQVCFVDRFPDDTQALAVAMAPSTRWILLSRSAVKAGASPRELLAHEIAHPEVWLNWPEDGGHGPRWIKAYRRALRVLEM